MKVQQGKCWYSYVEFSFSLIHLAGIAQIQVIYTYWEADPPPPLLIRV